MMNSLMQLSIIAEKLNTKNTIGNHDNRNIVDPYPDKLENENNYNKVQQTSSSCLPYPDHNYAKHFSSMVVPYSMVETVNVVPPKVMPYTSVAIVTSPTPFIPPPILSIPSPPRNGLSDSWEGSITRCICEFEHDDGYMICCDRCSVWQHVDCMGVDRNNIPDVYLCELCEPRYVDKHHAIRCQTRKKEGPLILQQKIETSDSDSLDELHSKNNLKKRRPKKTLILNNLNLKKELQTKNLRPPRPLHDKNTNINHRHRSSTEQHIHPLHPKLSKLANVPTYSFKPASFSNIYTPELIKRLEGMRKLNSSLDPLKFTGNILEGSLPPVDVSMIQISPDIKAQGLEASCDIKKNSPIIEFTGNIMLRSQYQPSGSYSFVYFYTQSEWDLDICIDASVHDNSARYVRRSCKPNAEIQHFFDENGGLRFCMWSISDILQGTEVTVPLEFQPQKQITNNRIQLPVSNYDNLFNVEPLKQRKKSSDHNLSRQSSQISIKQSSKPNCNSLSPKQSDSETKSSTRKLASPPIAKTPKIKPLHNTASSTKENLKIKNSADSKINKNNVKDFLIKSESEKDLRVAKSKDDLDERDNKIEKKHDRRLSSQISLLEDSKVNYERSYSLEGSKMSREEKKLEAILKAFERIEKKTEKKSSTDKPINSKTNLVSPKLNGRPESLNKNTELKLNKKKLDVKKSGRGIFRLRKHKYSDESDESDDIGSESDIKPDIDIKDAVFENDMEENKQISPKAEVKPEPKTELKVSLRPKKKQIKTNVKLKTQRANLRYFKRSVISRPTEISSDNEGLPASDDVLLSRPRVRINSHSSTPPNTTPITPIESNPSYTKKRWLRQAINEVHDDVDSNNRHDCTSPLPTGVSTPLKKRRLTVDSPTHDRFLTTKNTDTNNLDPIEVNDGILSEHDDINDHGCTENLPDLKLSEAFQDIHPINSANPNKPCDESENTLGEPIDASITYRTKIKEACKVVYDLRTSNSIDCKTLSTINTKINSPIISFPNDHGNLSGGNLLLESTEKRIYTATEKLLAMHDSRNSDDKIMTPLKVGLSNDGLVTLPIGEIVNTILVNDGMSYIGDSRMLLINSDANVMSLNEQVITQSGESGHEERKNIIEEIIESSTPATKKKVSLLEYRQRMKTTTPATVTAISWPESENESMDVQPQHKQSTIVDPPIFPEKKLMEKIPEVGSMGWSFEATAAERILDKRLKVDSTLLEVPLLMPDQTECSVSAPMSPIVQSAMSPIASPLNIPLIRIAEPSNEAVSFRNLSFADHFVSTSIDSDELNETGPCGRVEVVKDVMIVDSQKLIWKVDEECRDVKIISLKDNFDSNQTLYCHEHENT